MIEFILDGVDYGEPRNWQSLEIHKDFSNKSDDFDVNLTELSFTGDSNRYIKQRIMNGVSGGVGIFEGIPFNIIFSDNGSNRFIFNGYLDCTDNMQKIGGEETIISLKKYQGNDWINDVADSFSFAYLYDKGIISDSDFIKVPYIINYVPDGTQMILLSISLFIMVKEMYENIKGIAEEVASLVDSATPVIGAGVGFGAVVVTAWDIGNFIFAGLKLAARIIYLIAIVKAIKELMDSIMEQIFPSQKYRMGMTFKRMAERACQYLGLGFRSELLDSIKDWVYVPESITNNKNRHLGFPPNTSAYYTFGDFIRRMQDDFNADFRIRNGILYIERRDYFDEYNSFTIPDFFTNQERLLDVDYLNTNEMIANYNINFAYDTQDLNTMYNQTGRVFQAITSPNIVNDRNLLNIKGLKEVQIPLSLGLTKNNFTDVENFARKVAKTVDDITGIFGGGTNYSNKIKNRLGSLLISSDFMTSAKIVCMRSGKLVQNQRAEINAKKIWDNYHSINSFVKINGIHNQYYIYKNVEIPLTFNEFSQILESNIGITNSGLKFKIDKLIFVPYKNKAYIDYRINKEYTNNLNISYVE